VTKLAFDRARLDALRLGTGAALYDLHHIRCDDPAAAEVMRDLRLATQTLGELWLPRIQDVVNSKAMDSCIRRKNADGSDVAEAPGYAALQGMESIDDPWPVLGPASPHHNLTFDEVLSDIRSGAMLPMPAPIDAHGRAGHRYDSLAFAPTVKPVLVGAKDLTPNLLKVIDFFSDGLPIGWRETKTLSIFYLTDARVTSSVHRLTAYDRDDGPETLLDMATQATVSGYMIIASDRSVAEVTLDIGAEEDADSTKSFAVAEQESESYVGGFYPDEVPDLQSVTPGPRFESPDMWTFTTSASPMVDGWGTWESPRKRRS
jgi:hypothetical protein